MIQTRKTRRLRFPSAGVVRRMGYEDSARWNPDGTYPTPWAVNVRGEDPTSLRLRGGSRPGLSKTNTAVPAALDLTDDLLTEGDAPLVMETGTRLGGETLTGLGVTAGTTYRDRLVAWGGSGDQAIYMSRQGNHSDFEFGKSVGDGGRALVFQLSEAGEVGGEPTAFVSHKDQYALAATRSSLWSIHGDPAGDGTLRCVHRQVGIVSQTAWCKAVDDVIFLARNDLYRVQASGAGLDNLTKGNIPEEMLGLSSSDAISLGYAHNEQGVYIFLGGCDHWFYHIPTNSFWPMEFPAGMDPLATAEVEGELLLTCADGVVRTFQVDSDDDGTAIESHLLIGPLLMDTPLTNGRLLNLQGLLGQLSEDVTWHAIVADSAEEAVANAADAIAAWQVGDTTSARAYAAYSGTLVAGRSHICYPRVRGIWLVLWLHASGPWSYESLLIETTSSGSWR